jgi:hypothetical protein
MNPSSEQSSKKNGIIHITNYGWLLNGSLKQVACFMGNIGKGRDGEGEIEVDLRDAGIQKK